jgi:hypothetical protein
MSAPITLLQDANGELWYKHFRIDKMSFDEANSIGYLHGVDPFEDSCVQVSISSPPIVKPIRDPK